MGFKKIRYDSGENVVRISIEDETRRIMDRWVLMISDLPSWFDGVKRKYGLSSRKLPEDLEWLK